MNNWYVYIVCCKDHSLYTWVTTNIKNRLRQHNWEIKWGAKYTTSRKPVKLVYLKLVWSKSEACKEEYRIKQLTKREKQQLVESYRIL